MALERDRSGVPTLTEVISRATVVDLLLDVPSAGHGVAGDEIGEAQTDAFAFAEVTIPFTKATIPSVSALLASLESEASEEEMLLRQVLPEAIAQVMSDVQRQLDVGLEARLREVLAPVLARATDTIVRETCEQLASTLREIVHQVVAQELARHRDR